MDFMGFILWVVRTLNVCASLRNVGLVCQYLFGLALTLPDSNHLLALTLCFLEHASDPGPANFGLSSGPTSSGVGRRARGTEIQDAHMRSKTPYMTCSRRASALATRRRIGS